MPPSAIDPAPTDPLSTENGTSNGEVSHGKSTSSSSYREPLKLSGALDEFKYEETTPVIGREFLGVNIVDDILNAEDADAKVRDLAITISQRGVVFFRSQYNLTDALQKRLIQRLGELSGKPSTSTLHIHPVLNNTSEFGVADPEISVISSEARRAFFKDADRGGAAAAATKQPSASAAAPKATHPAVRGGRKYDSAQWHSDIQFERCPADYTSLRLTQLPSSGGDTLWASGYELYDRFSPPYQKFLEGLSATFSGDGFLTAAAQHPDRVKIHEGPRGSPENVDRTLSAVHPVVRTNPVTGWKSVFAVGPFPKRIEGLYEEESAELLAALRERVERSHDLQVRWRWRGENDLAIWDNRSAFHTATFDYDGLGERKGNRAVGIGERPYLDPNSGSRAEWLARERQQVADKAAASKDSGETKQGNGVDAGITAEIKGEYGVEKWAAPGDGLRNGDSKEIGQGIGHVVEEGNGVNGRVEITA